MVGDFTFARTPEIHFGAGKFELLPSLAGRFGKNVLLITGGRSFPESDHYIFLKDEFKKRSIRHSLVKITGEPSPNLIDGIINEYMMKDVDIIVAIGGGSVLDAGKAVAAMMSHEGFVEEYLEGIGTGRRHPGRRTPFIALPTTAGTGSEATKNAVLSSVGKGGYKRSLRHESFVPDIALVDPVLTLSCPPNITAACGMDAFTQLLESYVSVNSSPMTDALCLSGLLHIKKGLHQVMREPGDLSARSSLSYAALISGITLANAGLGTVHGFASTLGGYFDIPHGILCGTLMGAVTRANIKSLRQKQGSNGTLEKYARAGRLFSSDALADEKATLVLTTVIDQLTEDLKIPKLSQFGIQSADLAALAGEISQKHNPVKLSLDELVAILNERT